jgi:hypothetical protein
MATITKRRTSDGRVIYERSGSTSTSSGSTSNNMSFDDMVRWFDLQSGATDERQQAQFGHESGLQSDRLRSAEGISSAQIGSNERMTQAEIDARLEIAKQEIDFKYAEMEQLGKPQLELDKWYREQQIRLAEMAHQLDRQRLVEEVAARREQLGLDYLEASLERAQDPFALSAFLRGAQDRGGVPLFMQSLMSGVNAAPYAQTGPVPPTPITGADLVARLSQGSVSGVPQPQLSGGAQGYAQGFDPAKTVQYKMIKGGVDGWYDLNGNLIKASGTSVGSAPSGYQVVREEDLNQEPPSAPFSTSTMGLMSADDDARLMGATAILDAPHRISPGGIEGMYDPEWTALESAAKFTGRSVPDFLKTYMQSQTKQGSALAA